MLERSDHYSYRWDAIRIDRVFKRKIYKNLIETDAFTRLADIRFLGAIDYFVHPTGRELHRRRHTRLEHTLGVAHLALVYSSERLLSEEDEKLVVCSALLHDIGHAPLSHSLEVPFRNWFHIDHHSAGNQIILGQAPNRLGCLIYDFLKEEKMDPAEVIALIAGKSDSAHNFLFSHPVNIDTMEAISRSETYMRPHPASPAPDGLLRALLTPGSNVEKIDEFWKLKDQVYRHLIQGPLGVLADYLSINFVEDHISEFSEDDFFINEKTLRRRHPNLFKALEAGRRAVAKSHSFDDRQVEVSLRHFYIDENYPAGDANRYKTKKEKTIVPLASLENEAHTNLSRTYASSLFEGLKKY